MRTVKNSAINVNKLNKIDKELDETMKNLNMEIRENNNVEECVEMINNVVNGSEIFESVVGNDDVIAIELDINENMDLNACSKVLKDLTISLDSKYIELDKALEGEEHDEEYIVSLHNEIIRLESGIENAKSRLNVLKKENMRKQELQAILGQDNVIRLHAGIKYAIKQGALKPSKGLSGKQHKAILDMYKYLVGIDMDIKQVNYLKTINDTQARYILESFRIYSKTYKAN